MALWSNGTIDLLVRLSQTYIGSQALHSTCGNLQHEAGVWMVQIASTRQRHVDLTWLFSIHVYLYMDVRLYEAVQAHCIGLTENAVMAQIHCSRRSILSCG